MQFTLAGFLFTQKTNHCHYYHLAQIMFMGINSIFIYIQLIVLSHLITYLPMVSKTLNAMECLNEIFVLLFSYNLLLFTDLVPDVLTRYNIGNYLMYLLMIIIGLDCLIIMVEFCWQLYKYYKRWRNRRNITN